MPVHCPECHSAEISVSNENQRWICRACNAQFDTPVTLPPPLALGEQPPRAVHDEGMYFDPDDAKPPVQEREGDEGFDDWFQASEWYRPGVGLQLIRCARAAWA